DRELPCDDLRKLCRNTLKNYHKRTGCFDFFCVLYELASSCLVLALDFKAADGVDRLRRKSEMCNNGDRRLYDRFDPVADGCAALKLVGICAALLNKASCVFDCVVYGSLV